MTSDLVLTDTAIHGHPGAEAVAISGDRIAAVGSAAEIRDLIGPRTEVRSLKGRLVIPAFQDAHVHPVIGGMEMLRCDLTGLRTREACLAAVAAYAEGRDGWITGGGWMMSVFPGGTPLAADLDTVVSDRPVFLPSRDHHSVWVNSRAMELAGITADTPDPADGRIERDAAGRPTGVLHEGAMAMVEQLVPKLSLEDQVEALLAAQRYLHSVGITAWQDAIIGDYPGGSDQTAAYLEVISRGLLTARVRGCLWWRRDRGVEQLDDLMHLREQARPGFVLDAVKIMQDGVCENFTAATLSPYLGGHGSGISFFDPAELAEVVTAVHGAGFQAHFHTIGERAVRDALDAVEAALKRHGPRDLRHHLAHVQIVHPDDLSRFGELGVGATIQPIWAYNDDQMTDLTLPFLSDEQFG